MDSPKPHRDTRYLWPGLWQHYRTDTDFAQSIVRLLLGTATGLSSYWYFGLGAGPSAQSDQMILISSSWAVAAFLFSASCVKWPGQFWYRRIFGMCLDYFTISYLIVIGGSNAPPLIAALLWVTIGNGLRFGRGYLVVALGFALTSAVVIISLSPYWRTNPSLFVMMILCILIVPLYPFALLQRTSRAEQAARTANAEKSRYLAQASHDLRQPIHAIGLLASQIADSGETEQTRQTAHRISRAVHSTTEIVQTFLDVAVIESGTLVARPERVRLSDLFVDLEHQLSQSAAWSDTELRFVPTTQSAFIDRSFLKAMLHNLISNAIKYAPGSKVLIGCRRQKGMLTFYVIDSGRGMTHEHLARIKEPFYRAPGAGQDATHGTGLGLAIVQRLAELAAVRFDISSVPGRGTTAVLAGLQPAATAPEMPRPYAPPPIGQLNGTRILLIEDDDETRHATQALLQRWGCAVSAAAAPPQTPGDCDIVVSDFQFEYGETLGNHKNLLSDIKRAQLPLVMISGDEADHIRAALRPLTPIILAKPVSPAELRSVLMSAKLSRC
jgi:signal transduction histidine kinase/CheY-like chemotaxis protein